ncbi:MAG: hypothetical protein E7658_01190 [Ruminococcaceae bacterium]|nr:hypothetical protein [Oscillospiraceae bacterium]
MKRILSLILTLVLTLSAFVSCAPAEPENNGQNDLMQNISSTPVASPDPYECILLLRENSTSVNDFALRLFRAGMEEGKNTLISPLSVLAALSMTANGAAENTLAEMEAVLGMPADELNNWFRAYTGSLPESDVCKLSLANSIWFRDDPSFAVKEDFLRTNADYYNAGIHKAPFDETTRDEINKWVEDNTDGMIRDILDKIPNDVVMYLINALAFDAEWAGTYTENRIRDGVFTTEDGVQQDVEMMYSEENRYLEDEHAAGFIKYYKGGRYAFAALLPEEGMRITEYAAGLTGEHLTKMLEDAQITTVNTAIPKFETEYSILLNNTLQTMGMTDAFDPSAADFSGIGQTANDTLFISRVLHKTYINVDSKGTKAGAATVVEMSTECAVEPVTEPKQVYLDRPFVYMLIDCETNMPFFIGTMMDPKA